LYITGKTPLTTKLALHLPRDSNLIFLALQFATNLIGVVLLFFWPIAQGECKSPTWALNIQNGFNSNGLGAPLNLDRLWLKQLCPLLWFLPTSRKQKSENWEASIMIRRKLNGSRNHLQSLDSGGIMLVINNH
jgi:hypothetical protein